MSARTQLISCLDRLLNMAEVAMTNLNSLVTRMVARAFHAFVQGRLKAELLSDPEIILMPASTDAAVEQKRTPKRQRQLRASQAAPIHWAECSRADLPTIAAQ